MSEANQLSSKVNSDLQAAIQAIVTDRPIAYHPVLARAVGSVTAGILLSQLLYWTPRSQSKDGWVWKTREEIYNETALGRREQETARRILRDALVLEERLSGVPARLHFRVNMNRLVELLATPDNEEEPEEGSAASVLASSQSSTQAPKLGGFRPTSWQQSAQQDGRVVTNKDAQNRPTISESTHSETTPEKIHSKNRMGTPDTGLLVENSDVNQTTNSFSVSPEGNHNQVSVDSLKPRSDGRVGQQMPYRREPRASGVGNEMPHQEVAKRELNAPGTEQQTSDGEETNQNDALADERASYTKSSDRDFGHAPSQAQNERRSATGFETVGAVLSRRSVRPVQQSDPDREVIVEYIADFSRELGDEAKLSSSVTRAYNLYRKSGVDIATFTGALYTARSRVKEYTGNIRKRRGGEQGAFGAKNKMAYFFSVLEDVLGLRPRQTSSP